MDMHIQSVAKESRKTPALEGVANQYATLAGAAGSHRISSSAEENRHRDRGHDSEIHRNNVKGKSL